MNFTKGIFIRLPEGIDPDNFDFDHPSSLDFNAMYKCLLELIDGYETKTPVYCFKTHKQLPGQHKTLVSKDIIIFEGILCMHDERIRKLFDLKIFIHCDPDIALARRIRRDINERGRDVTEVLKRYNRFVKKDFDKYVRPQMKYVDVTIPGGASNDVAMNIIVQNLKNRLNMSLAKKSAALTIDDQLKDLLCLDLTKIASSSQLKCPTIEKKYLINTYLGMMQSDDIEFTRSNMSMLINYLWKNVLNLIETDLNHKIITPLGTDFRVYCKEYYTDQSLLNNKQPRFELYFETFCSNLTIEKLIENKKNKKGLPIYCAFIFIEKKAIERLYKEMGLLKTVCLYPQFNINSLNEIQMLNSDFHPIDQLDQIGDDIIRAKFEMRNK